MGYSTGRESRVGRLGPIAVLEIAALLALNWASTTLKGYLP